MYYLFTSSDSQVHKSSITIFAQDMVGTDVTVASID